ncbi:MAG: class I SAM-dependent methyltransferase [Planctomycetes bacterium]|nr:class I SAM-dependent methyltransferase [Planctomycetota bacterium]
MSTIVHTSAQVVYAACPLCDGAEFVPLGESACRNHPAWSAELPDKLRWQGCRACGHVFTESHWSDSALAAILAVQHAHQTPGTDVEPARRASARLVERLSTLRASFQGRWLDVGCGDGSLVTTAAEFGYDTVGIDVREESVKRLVEFGYAATKSSLEDFRDVRGFDVISLCDVLEHVPQPKRALARVQQLLAPHGLVLISCPNMDSFAWKWLDSRGQNPYWSELEHHHNFGRERLHALLAESGFEPCHFAVSERYRACMEIVARRR